MAGPWERYGGTAAPETVTLGSPNPITAQKDNIAIQKGQFDLQGAPLEIEGKRLDLQGKQLDIQNKQLDLQRSEADNKASDGEKTAAFLATRVKGGILDIRKALSANPDASTPTVSSTVASIFGPIPQNLANTPARRQIEAAQMDVLDAALTLGTGAAYSKEQLAGYQQAYFPQIGDDEATIAAKTERLSRLLESAKVKAGSAAPMIDEALASLNGSPQLTDDQIVAGIKERVARGDTPAATIQWLISTGRTPTDEQIQAIVANYGNKNPDVRYPDGSGPAGHALGVGVGGVLQGVGDVANIVSTPFTQGVNAVFGTDFNPDMGANLRGAVGTPEPQNDAERLAYAVNRGGTAALSLGGAAKAAAPYVPGVVGNALATFGGAPGADTVAGAAGQGSSEIARQQGAGPVGQLAAGFIGGGLTLPASARMNALATAPRHVETELTRAGQREGVTVNRVMADPNAQQKATAIGKTMVGGPMLQRGMRKVGGEIEGRVQALGSDGTPMEPSVAGDAIRRTGERYIQQSGAKLGKRYDALEREVGDIKVKPTNSVKRVDEAIARLSETANTNSAEISFLKGLKDDLSKDLSVGALRRLRTKLRKKISKGELTFGDDEATVLSVMDTAADDIASGLRSAGKGSAAARFKHVDADYRDRMGFIGGTVQKLVGRRGSNPTPEQVFSNFRSMASPKGDEAGLARMMREMTPEERSDIAATFADALGKNGDGEFSTAFLVKQAAKLPRGARVNIFGPDGAKSLDNLVTLAKEHKRVAGALGGSPTAVGNDYRSILMNFVFGGGVGVGTGSTLKGAAVAAAGLGIKAGRDAINAKLLLNDNIQRWLRTAPRTSSPKAINEHFNRLKALAVREPALSDEIQHLQQFIMKAANENVTPKVAASESDQQNN